MCPSTNVVISTEETPNTFVKTVPGKDSSGQGSNQIEPPRRIQRTREPSREDAIALTRQFFATVNEQNQMIMSELPVEVPTVISGGNVTLNLNIPITSATPTKTETRSPRTFSLMDHLLDLLQQPPLDHRCGYNVFWRDR